MTTLSRVLGAAVAGLGVGEQHARAFRSMSDCRLRAVFDVDHSRADRLAGEFGDVTSAPTFEALLADPDVDIISIASYDDAHFGQVVAALEASKHVFVEKPLCRTHDELRTIAAAWRRADPRRLGVNLVLRGAPLYRWLREAIAGGELGEIYAFDGDYLYGRLHKITDGWRKDVVDYSVMQGGGVHLVDLMLWLTGQRPDTVSAVGTNLATRGTGFRYNDFMAATYTFASGMVGRITANFGCVQPHQHVVRVFGTRGTFVYDDRGARLHTSRDPEAGARRLDLASLPATKGVLIPGFVDAILSGADRTQAAQHEFNLISACLAADVAVATGAAHRIDYV